MPIWKELIPTHQQDENDKGDEKIYKAHNDGTGWNDEAGGIHP